MELKRYLKEISKNHSLKRFDSDIQSNFIFIKTKL